MGYCVVVTTKRDWPQSAYSEVMVVIENLKTGILERTKIWRVVGKPPADLATTPFREGQGTWEGEFGDMIRLLALDKKTTVMELRRASGKSGPAWNPKQGAAMDTHTTWRRVATPGMPGLWGGFVGKLGAAVGLGAEDGVGIVYSAENFSRWFLFSLGNLKVGAYAGIGGGLSFALWTGIKSPSQADGAIQGGSDWAISLGAKWGTLAKNLAGVEKIEELSKMAENCYTNVDKVIAGAKSIYGELCLDYDSENLVVIGTPVGASLELGYYWYVGATRVLAQGNGAPDGLPQPKTSPSQGARSANVYATRWK